MSRLKWLFLATGILLFNNCTDLAAQSFPSGPVRLFVGFAAGGSTDIIARDLGNELEKVWGQPVIVENRAGANGSIAAGALAKLPADGQTLMLIVSGHITNSLLYSNLGFDAIKDFVPISLVASSPLLIFAHPSFPANDIKTLLELAKANPNTISYATPGAGSIQHLSLELLSFLSGIKLIHVPYRGGAPALNDVLGGHVPLSVLSVLQALPHVQQRALKPLAVTSAERTEVLPDVPTMVEAGVRSYEAELWFGLIAPAGTPPTVIAKINADVARIVKSEGMRARLAAQGARPIGSTPDEFAAFLRTEQDKWALVIKEAKIKAD